MPRPRKEALDRRVNVEGSILLERRCENVRALSEVMTSRIKFLFLFVVLNLGVCRSWESKSIYNARTLNSHADGSESLQELVGGGVHGRASSVDQTLYAATLYIETLVEE